MHEVVPYAATTPAFGSSDGRALFRWLVNESEWALVAEIFAEALQKPAGERSAVLAMRCAGFPHVQQTVERLLAANEAAGSAFLDQLDADVASALLRSDDLSPMKAGPYRLVRQSGAAGWARSSWRSALTASSSVRSRSSSSSAALPIPRLRV